MPIGKINHFSNADTIKKSFMAWEDMLEVEAPIYKLFNIGPSVNTLQVETAVAEETIFTGKVGDTDWNDTDVAGLSITSELAALITNYAVLQVEKEIVVVKEVDRAGNTITVFKRGSGETAAATHSAGTDLEILGFNMPRGVKDIESNYKEQVLDYNVVGKYTVPALSFNREQLTEARAYYGTKKEDYISSQILEKDKDLIKTIDKLLLKGTREAGANDGEPGMSRGLLEEASLKGNVVTGFGKLDSVKKLNDALKPSRSKSGRANFILVSLNRYMDLQELVKSEVQLANPFKRLSIELGDNVIAINTIVGRLIPIISNDLDDDTIIVGNMSDFSIHPFEGFTIPGGDKTIAQESARNDQAFTYDSICQFVTYFKNSNKNLTKIEGVTD